jgi:hypothetical protein
MMVRPARGEIDEFERRKHTLKQGKGGEVLTLTIPAKPTALATAAVTKYAAERPPRRQRELTVHGSKDPSHSLSESPHFRERQRVKSWTAKRELRRAPMNEVTKTMDLYQRGMID